MLVKRSGFVSIIINSSIRSLIHAIRPHPTSLIVGLTMELLVFYVYRNFSIIKESARLVVSSINVKNVIDTTVFSARPNRILL